MKHKKILDLQSSPRKKRSHSLNSIVNNREQIRSIEIRRVSLPQPLVKRLRKVDTDDSLYCTENLGNVSELDNKSNEQSSSSSSKYSMLEEEFDGGESDCFIDYEGEGIDIIEHFGKTLLKLPELTSNDSNEKSFLRRNRLPEPQVFPVENDPIDKIKWDAGIGYLSNSKLNFQFNEFGLLEIMSKKEFRKIHRANHEILNVRPLSERESRDDPERKVKMENSETNMIYMCLNCDSNGLASEFHTSDYCSNFCLKQHFESKNRKSNQIQSSSTQSIVVEDVIDNEDKPSPKSENIDDLDLDQVPCILKDDFNWEDYITYRRGPIANRRLFTSAAPSSFLPLNRFALGDKVEAIDPENSSIIGVATVIDKQGYRVKIHFDGYPAAYDFWTNVDSLDVLPAGFCDATNRELHVPPNYNKKKFSWAKYLVETKSVAAQRCSFPHVLLSEYENRFKPDMKLEAYDLRNSEKICVASVKDVIGNKVLIHFDGWDDVYDYWVPITSPHIHSINWHQENGFTLTHPPGKFYFIF